MIVQCSPVAILTSPLVGSISKWSIGFDLLELHQGHRRRPRPGYRQPQGYALFSTFPFTSSAGHTFSISGSAWICAIHQLRCNYRYSSPSSGFSQSRLHLRPLVGRVARMIRVRKPHRHRILPGHHRYLESSSSLGRPSLHHGPWSHPAVQPICAYIECLLRQSPQMIDSPSFALCIETGGSEDCGSSVYPSVAKLQSTSEDTYSMSMFVHPLL